MTLLLIVNICIMLAVGLFFWLRREVKRNMPWLRYEKAVFATYPEAKKHFQSGASESQLESLTDKFSFPIPASFLRMLSATNGGQGILYGVELLSVDGIMRAYDDWKLILDDGLEGFTDNYCSFPTDTIQPVYVDKSWLPFASDGAGNYIALDFNPGPNGKTGQVISFGADEIEMCQLAPDFDAFLALLHGLVGHKQVIYNADSGTFRFRIYIVDVIKSYLKKVADA